MNISQDNKNAMRNPWVLGWLGLLITVVGVNIAFIVTAFKTNPGLVEESYYEKGRDVEKNFQKKLEARNRLGWDIRLQTPEEIILGKPTFYTVNIVDRVGMPLQDATVTLQAYRPSDASADSLTTMKNIATGVYQARIALPLKGIWDLKVKVNRGEDELEMARRISASAP
jgi:nitrogen fixation protein FixH